jgi:hypothetical protein
LCNGCWLGLSASRSRRENDKMTGGMSKVKKVVAECAHDKSDDFHRVEHACYITRDRMNKQCLRCSGDMTEKMYCAV